jgi:hypothetical protein
VVAVLLILTPWNRWIEPPRTDLRHIPPEWIGYRQIAVFACPTEGTATCFALFGDSTFVIGSADPPRLSFFDETGTLLRTMDLPEKPLAIACGTPETIFSGKIVVAHPNNIVVYNAEGQAELLLWENETTSTIFSSSARRFPLLGTGVLGSEQMVNIRSLALTPKYLFAADTGNRMIYRFNAEDHWDVLRIGSQIGVRMSDINFEWLGKRRLHRLCRPDHHDVFPPERFAVHCESRQASGRCLHAGRHLPTGIELGGTYRQVGRLSRLL